MFYRMARDHCRQRGVDPNEETVNQGPESGGKGGLGRHSPCPMATCLWPACLEHTQVLEMRLLTGEGPGKPFGKLQVPCGAQLERSALFPLISTTHGVEAVPGRRFWEQVYGENIGGKSGFHLQVSES